MMMMIMMMIKLRKKLELLLWVEIVVCMLMIKPIVVTLLGIVTDISDVQYWKAP